MWFISTDGLYALIPWLQRTADPSHTMEMNNLLTGDKRVTLIL